MNTKPNDGGPAFPGFDYIDQGGRRNPPGMTLRDYFAAAAMNGVMAKYELADPRDLALCLYEIADAMLTERARKEAQP